MIPPGSESSSEVLLDHGGLQREGRSRSTLNANSPVRPASEGAARHLHVVTLEHEDGGAVFPHVLDADCEQRAEHAGVRQRFHLHNVADVHRLQLHLGERGGGEMQNVLRRAVVSPVWTGVDQDQWFSKQKC